MIVDLSIQNPESSFNFFSTRNYFDESFLIANSNLYHIVYFKNDCFCNVNFNEHKVVKNTLLYLGPSDVFYCKEQEQKICFLSFNKNILNQNNSKVEMLLDGLLFNNLFRDFFLKLSIKEGNRIESNISSIKNYSNKSNLGNVKIALKEIFIHGLSIKHEFVMLGNENSPTDRIIYQYLSLVNKNFRMEHNVCGYAQMMGLQPKYLTKIFFDLKMETPKQFINKRILLAAEKLLTFTSSTVVNISYDLGFNEPAYFSRFFKKNSGLTAKQFRKNNDLSIGLNSKKEKSPTN